MLENGTILGSKYEILKPIGKGGMSTVYLAKDLKLEKVWAVKEIDKTTDAFLASVNRDGTLTEIEILKSIDHPFAPRIVDIYDSPCSMCVVMDYIKGQNLQSLISEKGAVSPDIAASWTIDAARLISYLHANHIIYRDMKPSNIIITEDGGIKVIDFGIAKYVKNGIYTDAAALGTRGYASPEHKAKCTDERSDIYTLGVMLYQLVTGDSPVKKGFKIKPLREISGNLPLGLDEIIKKATSESPERRYQSADEFISALAAYKKLESPYRKKLERRIKTSSFIFLISLILFGAGLISYEAGTVMEYKTYISLTEYSTPSRSERIEKLKDAVNLKPGRPEAITELLSEYAKDGLSLAELSEITDYLEIYDQKNLLKSKSYAKLYYDCAMDIFIYSEGDCLSNLVKAQDCFEKAASGKSEYKALASSLLYLARFTNSEMTSSSAQGLLDNIRLSVINTDSYIGKGSNKLRESIYEISLELLSSNIKQLIKLGISKDQILKTTDEIISRSESLDNNIKLNTLKELIEESL